MRDDAEVMLLPLFRKCRSNGNADMRKLPHFSGLLVSSAVYTLDHHSALVVVDRVRWCVDEPAKLVLQQP